MGHIFKSLDKSEDNLIKQAVANFFFLHFSPATQTHYLLLLCSLELIYHGPRVNFGIHSKTMHGDVQEIAPLSAFSLQALKEAGYHARRHPSSGKLICKLKTHNLRSLMSTKSGSNAFREAIRGKRKDGRL